VVPIAIGRYTRSLESFVQNQCIGLTITLASVYILSSQKLKKFYIGSCFDLELRLTEHKNNKYVDSFTTLANDWELFLEMSNLEGVIARKIEKHIKSMKSKSYIENLKRFPEMRSKLISRFSNEG